MSDPLEFRTVRDRLDRQGDEEAVAAIDSLNAQVEKWHSAYMMSWNQAVANSEASSA